MIPCTGNTSVSYIFVLILSIGFASFFVSFTRWYFSVSPVPSSVTRSGYAVVVWGELRGVKSCVHAFERLLVAPLNATVYVIAQHYFADDYFRLESFRKNVAMKRLYHRPTNLTLQLNISRVETQNIWMNEAYLQQYNNMALISNLVGAQLRKKYEYVIMMRSDYFHLIPFPDLVQLLPPKEKARFFTFTGHDWGGINFTLMVVPARYIQMYLNALMTFSRSHSSRSEALKTYNKTFLYHPVYPNTEEFMLLAFKRHNWTLGRISTSAYLTAEAVSDRTTWGKVSLHPVHNVLQKYTAITDAAYHSHTLWQRGFRWNYDSTNHTVVLVEQKHV